MPQIPLRGHCVWTLLLLACILGVATSWSRDFNVVAYNVENLFDVDGKASYDDYQPGRYGPAKLATKIGNISQVLSRLAPNGPDIVLLNEIEVDQTPAAATADIRALVDSQKQANVRDLLSKPLTPALQDWPAEAWLLKAIEDAGLKGYTVVAGDDYAGNRHEDGNVRAIKCVILTKFPVKEVRNHPIPNARNIVEVLLDVDGSPLRVFANHWKAGAGDPKLEKIRVEDARVLRHRIDELLTADPKADIIIGGDFNSQYNQRQRNPKMDLSAIEDILGSQGNERALRDGSARLYNLWYELPPAQRGSDIYHGEWGTLIQLLITPGMQDLAGIHYVDNSFHVGRIPGLNAAGDGTPIRWNGGGVAGSGFSDHFPVLATFSTSPGGSGWMKLDMPSTGEAPSQAAPKVESGSATVLAQAQALDLLPPDTHLQDESFIGKLFLVSGEPVFGQRLAVRTSHGEFEVYAPDKEFRDRLRQEWKSRTRVRFYGEFGQYKGHWQFVIKDAAWFPPQD